MPKPNGEVRFILNLQKLNQFIYTEHFKLEDIRTVTKLMTPGCSMDTIDLKAAYFCLPIHHEHKKYLSFLWKGKTYEFSSTSIWSQHSSICIHQTHETSHTTFKDTGSHLNELLR